MTQEEYVSDAVDLLKKLIATPSVRDRKSTRLNSSHT